MRHPPVTITEYTRFKYHSHMPQSTIQPISDSEFSLETAHGSVKPASDDRDLDDIIRDAKDEKASLKSSATTNTSTQSPTSKDGNQP